MNIFGLEGYAKICLVKGVENNDSSRDVYTVNRSVEAKRVEKKIHRFCGEAGSNYLVKRRGDVAIERLQPFVERDVRRKAFDIGRPQPGVECASNENARHVFCGALVEAS